MASKTVFPLEKTQEKELEGLANILWSWTSDASNTDGRGGNLKDSMESRSTRLVPYFNYYKELTGLYECDLGPGEQLALSCHDDLFRVINALKENPEVSRTRLVAMAFANSSSTKSNPFDQDQALSIAVRAMYMMTSASNSRTQRRLEDGLGNSVWSDRATFAEFFSETFSMSDHPSVNDKNAEVSSITMSALMGKKLKKVAGVTFHPTDDIGNHLKLNHKNGVVEIFHHTAFLKEHLRLTKDNVHLSVIDSLKKGALPRQLALEILDSIQKVLFPLTDPKSNLLLRSLTASASFDPDCLRFESTSIRTANEKDIQYLYFGSRLITLLEELENPTPRGWMQEWFEEKSGARYVMMATFAGVAIAIFLGLASIGVGGYQAWVGYQAWKHPVLNPVPK